MYYYTGTNTISKLARNIHEGSIFSICVLKDGFIVTGGGKDGKILYFDESLNLTGGEAQVSLRKYRLKICIINNDQLRTLNTHSYSFNPSFINLLHLLSLSLSIPSNNKI